MLTAAILIALLHATPAVARDECFNTCLDYCQTSGSSVADACSCDFGTGPQCACLCDDDPGSHSCGDFPGCEASNGLTRALARVRRDALPMSSGVPALRR